MKLQKFGLVDGEPIIVRIVKKWLTINNKKIRLKKQRMDYEMIVGITGSIATGKSIVTNYLKSLGYPIIDSDEIAHRQLDDPVIIREIVEKFGEEILIESKVDRLKLGKIIFRNPKSRETLNQIIHPGVISEIKTFYSSHHGLIFVDIPLLFEAKLESLVDKTIVVYTSMETQLKRLMLRDNINEEYAKMKIASQFDIEEKKKKADFLINNEGDILNTYLQVEEILRRLKNEN